MLVCLIVDSPFVTGNQEDKDEYNSEEDGDFEGDESGKEGESLGSVNTDTEENEVEDLHTDFENMPTSCTTKSTTPKKATPKTASVDNLSTQMSSMKFTNVESTLEVPHGHVEHQRGNHQEDLYRDHEGCSAP
jgi:hypothetical protein